MMPRALLFLAAAAALLLGPASASSQDKSYFIQAKMVYPVSSEPIASGRILVRGGRIAAVGADLRAPEGAVLLEAAGAVVPGFIDCGSTLALEGPAADEFRELTPEIRAADALDLDDPTLARALRSGVTASAIIPGDRNVIGGLGAVIGTAPATFREAVLAPDALLAISLSDSASASNQSLRFSPPTTYYHRIPTTRMGTVFLARRALFEALDLVVPEGLEADGERHLAALLTPAGKKVLAESARGKRPVRVHVEEKQEILAALRLADEFQIPIAIEGFIQGAGLISEIARRRIDVLLYPGAEVGRVGPGERTSDQAYDLARLLQEAGVRFGFFSGRGSDVPELCERVALDIRTGLPEKAALRALTLDAARILGIDRACGSIEPGKRADLAAFSGDPFAAASRIEWVLSGGRLWRGLQSDDGGSREISE